MARISLALVGFAGAGIGLVARRGWRHALAINAGIAPAPTRAVGSRRFRRVGR